MADPATRADPWLPSWFRHPTRLELPSGHHLRPLRALDLDLDLPAVRGAREHLWSCFGEAWGWPPAELAAADDLCDLQRQEREMAEGLSFSYALLDEVESELLGCVYLDPPRGGTRDADVDVTWWVVDALRGGEVEHLLTAAVVTWVRRCWPFTRPRFVGLDISWRDWARSGEP
ncbi:hypothetical protein FHR75_002650 [Kineococcus radiotolerans]|uniref:N-acetyltransferase domain-containing protein n=2 Tax=Kineococcus radiotolerans TaxID=131568 RepID=A6WDV1_KINRD|nr:hypothetical protein [Kineococcus radiotolerans]ABS04990.1 conserved hypothetical protein [Kineococcus radiotolerans SRS30216 = ATCC BAA-149]MBB2901835.1 hypothetical protein [Kineococcus radiotolerans]